MPPPGYTPDPPGRASAQGERWRGAVDRLQECNQRGAVSGVGQSIGAAAPGAAVRDIFQHVVEGQSRAVVEVWTERVRPQQRRRIETIGPERRGSRGADFVPGIGVESADLLEEADQ